VTATIDAPNPGGAPDPAAPPSEGRLAHQPALDGIRALAVIAVVLYHDCVNRPRDRWVPGGFLGVDVFLVLSGFLITGILLTNRERTGRTATKQFWIRRARRLLPALLVMLLFAAAYGYFASPKWELASLWSQTVATMLYVENWFTLYGTPGRAPIAHTWSLSIEEQWYFVWPFLLAGLLVLTRNRRRPLILAITGLAIASAIFMAITYARGGWPHGYYSTFSRAGELLLGGLIAVALRESPVIRNRAASILVEVGALASLGYLAWQFRYATPFDAGLYRGGFYLVAIATAIIIVAALQPTSRIVRPAFAWRPLAAIGLVSYGVYLYHVPLFRWMSPEATGLSTWPLLAARLAVLAVMAIASYLLIEMPVRNGRLQGREGRLAVVAVVVTLAVVYGVTRANIPRPPWVFARDRLATAAGATPPGVDRVLVAGELDAFDLSAQTGRLIYTGYPRVLATAVASLSCPIAGPRPVVGDAIGPKPDCTPWPELFAAMDSGFRPDVAILMAGQSAVFDRAADGRILRVGTPEYATYLRSQLDRARRILQPADQPLVLTTVPCIAGVAGDSSMISTIMRDPERLAWVNSVWRAYADNHPKDVELVDLAPLLCPAGDARPLVDGAAVRDANGRLTPAGATALWAFLIEAARGGEGRSRT
jgi:peptidoglycan/LPS O-acetylase OafA/YrhL